MELQIEDYIDKKCKDLINWEMIPVRIEESYLVCKAIAAGKEYEVLRLPQYLTIIQG